MCSMTEMELQLAFFKRVLRYFIANHKSYTLLKVDGLSELYASYNNGWLLWDCFEESRTNPLLKVSKDSITDYLEYMRTRLNALIPQVLEDMRKEYEDYTSKLMVMQTEMMELNQRASIKGYNEVDVMKYNIVAKQCNAVMYIIQQFEVIFSWNPQFVRVLYKPSVESAAFELEH